MKKITGELLNRCEKLEKEVKAILQTEMQEHFTPRKITYEYCNATSYACEWDKPRVIHWFALIDLTDGRDF